METKKNDYQEIVIEQCANILIGTKETMTIQETIRTFIFGEFQFLIEKILENEDNVVIGGSYAILLHGLKMSRKPEDLDLIIYRPSQKQLETLEISLGSRITADQRSVKIVKNGLILNFLLEKEKDSPENNLKIFFGGKGFAVQSIENVFLAKSLYKSVSGAYVRSKDVLDCIDLKNQNFNLK